MIVLSGAAIAMEGRHRLDLTCSPTVPSNPLKRSSHLWSRAREPAYSRGVALYPSDGSPITISRRPWAVRNACSTSSGVSPRAKRKPR